MAIYVEVCLTIGSDEVLNEVFESLKSHGFGLKVESSLTDYLSCKNYAGSCERKSLDFATSFDSSFKRELW